MAVPDTTTFSLQDVVTEINPTTDDLVDCFADADADLFDPTHQEDKNELLNFRNYDGNLQGLLYLVYPNNIYNNIKHAWSELDDQGLGDETDIVVGSGLSNSLAISQQITDSGLFYLASADLCLGLNANGYDDWFLPARDTLSELLYPVKAAVNTGISGQSGNIISSTDYYWSSSEYNRFNAYAVKLHTGEYDVVLKDGALDAKYARAIRIQQQVDVNAYDVGDYAFGGIVFKKYKYEATTGWVLVMHKDELATSVWSNVDVDLYPLVDSSFGEIETAAIIAQAGHTASAAKLCNDLTAEGYSDWFLPTTFSKINSYLTEINATITARAGDVLSTSDQIWSSRQTLLTTTTARLLYIDPVVADEDKQNVNKVRAVRKVFVEDLASVQYGEWRDGGVVVLKSYSDPSIENARVLGGVRTVSNATEFDFYFSERVARAAIYLEAGMTLYTNSDFGTTMSAGTYLQYGGASGSKINYSTSDYATIVVDSLGVITSISGRKARAMDGFDYYTNSTTVVYRRTIYYDDSIGDANNLTAGDILYSRRYLHSAYTLEPSLASDGKWEQNGTSYTDINDVCTSVSTVGRIYVDTYGAITSISCV